jgi:shikimate kinase
MILQLKRTPGIYLVGFMGCGKSTIGRMLAQSLGWPFGDLDEDIERAEQLTIPEIFERFGEADFRRRETEALKRRIRSVQAGKPLVLALGGGAFTIPENVKLVKDNGISIWIDAPLALVKKRVANCSHRPLARDPEQFERLYLERRPSYAQADYRVELQEDDSRQACDAILRLPIFH